MVYGVCLNQIFTICIYWSEFIWNDNWILLNYYLIVIVMIVVVVVVFVRLVVVVFFAFVVMGVTPELAISSEEGKDFLTLACVC